MAFTGELVELKTGANYVPFPLKFIKSESYKVTPDQRMEASATRSTTGILVRQTVSHTASKIDFNTVAMTNNDVNTIQTLLSNAYTDAQERKLDLRYYNPATDSYQTGTFYVPDVDYNIIRIDAALNVVYYDSIRFAFIEY